MLLKVNFSWIFLKDFNYELQSSSSSPPDKFCKKCVLKKFAKLTEKHLTPLLTKDISLARTYHRNSKLSTNIQCERNNCSVFLIFQKICKKINKKRKNISDIFWAFKSKLHIIHAVTYIALVKQGA